MPMSRHSLETTIDPRALYDAKSQTMQPTSSDKYPSHHQYIDRKSSDTISQTPTFNDDEKPKFTEFKTYPQAWLALFMLVLLRTAVAVFQFTFSVVPETTSRFFGVSLTAVNWFATVQCIIYVFVSFFSGWIFERRGVKQSLCIAGFLNAFGAAIRLLAARIQPPMYAVAMIGQVVGSIASPLSLNIMTMFASTWFTEDKRATAGMFVASNYGAILGMFMIPNITQNTSQMQTMLLVVTAIAILGFVPLVFMPAKPPTPPSLAENTKRPPFFQGIRMLARNSDFWILFVIHGLNVGISIAFGTIFTQVISPYGYTDAQAGQINAVAFFTGTIGCSVAGPVLDKTKQHKLFLKLIAPMVLVTDIGFIFLIQSNAYAAILFVTGLNQFFLSFLVPVVIDLGSETAYPVSDATTSSFLWQGAQAFGFILVLVMDAIRDPSGNPPNNMFRALILQACLAGVIAILALVFNGRMKRSENAAWSLDEKTNVPCHFLTETLDALSPSRNDIKASAS